MSYRPVLPARVGYVEQEIDGVPAYIPTEETQRMLDLEERLKNLPTEDEAGFTRGLMTSLGYKAEEETEEEAEVDE